MSNMSNFPAFIAIVSLLVMYMVSAAHADTMDGALCDDMQVVSLHDCHEPGESQSDICDCAACGHHHHSHATLPLVKKSTAPSFAKTLHRLDGVTYLSQFHYPPSKPPKA